MFARDDRPEMPLDPPPRLFCFGLGFSADALAARLLDKGWRVAGTCRSEDKRAALSGRGIDAHIFDRDRPLVDPAAAFAGVTHILSSVPPDGSPGGVGDPVIDRHGDDLATLADLRWVGYLSTTGVYGDRGGDWVDEGSELRPSGERGRRRVAAEAAWLDLWWDHGLPVHLFRLAGIYGPGRNALESVRAGKAKRIEKPGQVFSRVHVADIAQVLAASIERPNPGAAYNVCDDDPAPPPLVPFHEAELSEMARSFYADNKRVRNDRIKTELGVRLAYPDYKVGLKALLNAG